MRYVAATGMVLLAVAGCAQGDKGAAADVDAGGVDVPGLEIGAGEVGDDATDSAAIADTNAPPDADATGTADATDATDAPDASEKEGGTADADASAADAPIDAPTDAHAEADVSAETSASDAAEASTDAPTVWSHTITIDGVNDFTAGETFATTSTGYTAYVTWDATYLYWGMTGADIGTTTSPTKWVFLYVDTDPGSGTGATKGVAYHTEQPSFPSGFGAEYYVRWKTDDSFATVEHYSAGAWSTASPTVERARAGNYVEFRVRRADLGAPAKVGVELFMMNEASGVEAAYAGIYAGNFTDGYHASIPFTKYLEASFASSSAPNDPARIKP